MKRSKPVMVLPFSGLVKSHLGDLCELFLERDRTKQHLNGDLMIKRHKTMSHEDQLKEESTFSMKVLEPFLYPSIQQVFIVWIKEVCWRYNHDQNIVLPSQSFNLRLLS